MISFLTTISRREMIGIDTPVSFMGIQGYIVSPPGVDRARGNKVFM